MLTAATGICPSYQGGTKFVWALFSSARCCRAHIEAACVLPSAPVPLPLSRLQVRDPRAGYLQTLSVLRAAKECGVYTKSSIMLGLGETGEPTSTH